MRKDNINIDDLFRKHLADGEFRDGVQSGWQSMHQLLDKEMPTEKRKIRGGFFKRYLPILLLLLTSAVTGGYIVQNKVNDKIGVSINHIASKLAVNGNETINNQNNKNNIINNSELINKINSVTTAHNEQQSNLIASTNSNISNQKANVKNLDLVPIKPENPKSKRKIESSSKSASEKSTLTKVSNVKNKKSKIEVEELKTEGEITQTVHSIGKEQEANRLLASNTTTVKSKQPKIEKETIEKNQLPKSIEPSNKNNYTRVHDSIKQIFAKEVKYLGVDNVVTKKLDTIAVAHIPVDKWIEDFGNIQEQDRNSNEDVDQFEKRNNEIEKITPQVAKKSGSKSQVAKTIKGNEEVKKSAKPQQSENLSSSLSGDAAYQEILSDPLLANQETKIETLDKSKANLYQSWVQQSLENLKLNTKHSIAQTKFYSGLLGGLNTRLSEGASMLGFHIGLWGKFSFNDRIGILAELKYIHNFSGNYPGINSSYVQNSKVDNYSSALNQYQRITADSISSNYNITMMNQLSVPIALVYSIKRFDILAGVNLNMFFGTQANEKISKYTISRVDSISLGQPFNPPSTLDRQKPIAENDFGSRIGLGANFGIGYHISPAVNVNVRYIQDFWTNAVGAGQKQVSNSIHKVPSVHLTIGYRFGSNIKDNK